MKLLFERRGFREGNDVEVVSETATDEIVIVSVRIRMDDRVMQGKG
jgi:hypothetical protein